MKRLFAAVMVIALALSLASCADLTPYVESSTQENTTATESLLIGEGENDDYKYAEYSDHIELTECKHKNAYVSLPRSINSKPVTSFGQIFRGSLYLVTLIIPNSYTEIDDRAFAECYKLQSVTIAEDGIKSIGMKAFYGCQALAIAHVPATVTDIAEDAFKYCTDLIIYGTQGSAVEEIANNFSSIYFRSSEDEPESAVEQSTDEGGSSEDETATN